MTTKWNCLKENINLMAWPYIHQIFNTILLSMTIQQNICIPYPWSVRPILQIIPHEPKQLTNPQSKGTDWKVMETEIKTSQESKNCWKIVDKEPWMDTLPSMWAFKWKYYPNGEVRKLKVGAQEDKQIVGVDYFNTFSPVTNWTTIRIMLIMSLLLNLMTKQVDYTAVLIYAPQINY